MGALPPNPRDLHRKGHTGDKKKRIQENPLSPDMPRRALGSHPCVAPL